MTQKKVAFFARAKSCDINGACIIYDGTTTFREGVEKVLSFKNLSNIYFHKSIHKSIKNYIIKCQNDCLDTHNF